MTIKPTTTIRIDPDVKKRAAKVFDAIGLGRVVQHPLVVAAGAAGAALQLLALVAAEHRVVGVACLAAGEPGRGVAC